MNYLYFGLIWTLLSYISNRFIIKKDFGSIWIYIFFMWPLILMTIAQGKMRDSQSNRWANSSFLELMQMFESGCVLKQDYDLFFYYVDKKAKEDGFKVSAERASLGRIKVNYESL